MWIIFFFKLNSTSYAPIVLFIYLFLKHLFSVFRAVFYQKFHHTPLFCYLDIFFVLLLDLHVNTYCKLAGFISDSYPLHLQIP